MTNLASPAQILVIKTPVASQLEYLSAYLKQAYQLANFPNPQTYLFNQNQESLKIAQVREAISQASFASYDQQKRFFCFLRADLATPPAQNALLKLLEEPPANSYCLLLVQNPQRLLATVQSRCITIDLDSYLTAQNRVEATNSTELNPDLSNQNNPDNAAFFDHFIEQPQTVTFSQLIDFVAQYKDREAALNFLQTSLQKLLSNQKLKLSHKTTALKALTKASQNLEANFNVVLTLENAFFSIKNLL